MMERKFNLIILFSYLFILRVIGQRKERRESLSTLTRTITSWHKATHKAIQLAIVKGAFLHPSPYIKHLVLCILYFTTKWCDIWIFWDWRWADRRECPRLRKVIFKLAEIANIGSGPNWTNLKQFRQHLNTNTLYIHLKMGRKRSSWIILFWAEDNISTFHQNISSFCWKYFRACWKDNISSFYPSAIFLPVLANLGSSLRVFGKLMMMMMIKWWWWW